MRPAWCRTCAKAYEAEAGAPCPRCYPPPPGVVYTYEAPAAPRLREANPTMLEDEHERELRLAQGDVAGGDAPLTNSLLGPDEARELADRFGVSRPPPNVVIEGPDDTRECPRCAERIKARAQVCRYCGSEIGPAEVDEGSDAVGEEPELTQELTRRQRRAIARRFDRDGRRRLPDRRRSSDSSPGLAVLFASVCFGLGHFYVGRFGRGLFFLLGVPLALGLAAAFASVALVAAEGGMPAYSTLVNTRLFFAALTAVAWIASMVDAYACACDANAPVERSRTRRY